MPQAIQEGYWIQIAGLNNLYINGNQLFHISQTGANAPATWGTYFQYGNNGGSSYCRGNCIANYDFSTMSGNRKLGQGSTSGDYSQYPFYSGILAATGTTVNFTSTGSLTLRVYTMQPTTGTTTPPTTASDALVGTYNITFPNATFPMPQVALTYSGTTITGTLNEVGTGSGRDRFANYDANTISKTNDCIETMVLNSATNNGGIGGDLRMLANAIGTTPPTSTSAWTTNYYPAKIMRVILHVASSAVIAIITLSLAFADVTLPAIFGDHMVLQEGINLPIWGNAAPGEKITVTFGNQSGTAQAGADGSWEVKLSPLPSDSRPMTLTLEGRNKVTFSDVMVGGCLALLRPIKHAVRSIRGS